MSYLISNKKVYRHRLIGIVLYNDNLAIVVLRLHR